VVAKEERRRSGNYMVDGAGLTQITYAAGFAA
jgi:hypothetical protein